MALSQTSFSCMDVGANDVTVTVTDASGNMSDCISVVTVIDDAAPICVANDVTVYLDAAGVATADSTLIDGGTSDNCGSFTFELDNEDYTCDDLGSNTVNITVSDGLNVTMCTAMVTVLDTICLLYTSPSPRDLSTSRMPSSA